MKRILIIAVVLVGFPAALAHASYVPAKSHACRSGYVAKTVKVRKHERKHGKLVWVKVRERVCVKKAAPKVVSTITPVTVTPVVTPITTPTLTVPTTSVRATIDPDWSLAVTTPQAPPIPVTFTFSASAGPDPLPDGELTLSIYVHASVSSAGGCEANVGGDTTSASCTVTLPAFGSYDLVTSYSSGVGNVAATGSTETVDVEPPLPLDETIISTWGVTAPTNTYSLAATVIGSNANVTFTDSNYEGATAVTLTDQLGDTCNATVTGTTANCTMAVTGIPASFTVTYPGGVDGSTTQTISPWGIPQAQTIDYQWPSEVLLVSNPNVTVQHATVQWSGGFVRDNGTVVTKWTGDPPNPLAITAGENVELNTVTIGSVASDLYPLGAIDYVTTPDDGNWTASNDLIGSADCSAAQNYSLEANADCYYTFTQSATQYTVTPTFLSADNAYANTTGVPLTIDVN